MSLFLDISTDDVLQINENTFVMLERKSGQRARLRIVGQAKVELLRNVRGLKTPPNPPATETGD